MLYIEHCTVMLLFTVPHGTSSTRCEGRRRRRCVSRNQKWFRAVITDTAWRSWVEASLLRQVLSTTHCRSSHSHQETATVQRRDRGRTSVATYYTAPNSITSVCCRQQIHDNKWN